MTIKVIFNTNKKLKDAAMRKARRHGLTLSAVLNMATEAYVADRLTISAFERDLAGARAEMRAGKGIPLEEALKSAGL